MRQVCVLEQSVSWLDKTLGLEPRMRRGRLRKTSDSVAVQPPPPHLLSKTLAPPHRMHALVVDSDLAWRAELAAFLRQKGFGVTLADDVDQALTYVGPLHFALISLDLPGRPGWQLWNRLATDSRGPLALFWGGNPADWERLTLRACARTAFIAKPFTGSQMIRALVELEQYRVDRV